MFYSYLQVLIPVFGLMLNVIVQVICSRSIPRLGLLKAVFLGFFAGMLSVLMIEFCIFFATSARFTDFYVMFSANFIIYASLGYCYFHFINLGETARRIRILREIYDSKDGLTMEEILQRYNSKEIVDKRLSRLINNGQVIYKDGRYHIGSPIMLMITMIIISMKLMLLGRRSEFDTY